MTTFEVIFLAIIQGLTEFLPISSSAHLLLPKEILGWKEQGLAFDVAVHVGTLLAVLIYFRQEVSNMLFAWIGSFKGNHNQDSKLAWWIIWGSIPLALFGYFGKELIEIYGRSAGVIAITTIVFGLLLWRADVKATQHKGIYDVGLKGAVIIGLSQMLALIPGTSRSGITITAGLMLGLDRGSAARFSFLLSIPAILMAGGYQGLKLVTTAAPVDWYAIGLGVALSFVSALACIHYFLIFVEKVGMLPFVIYRLILGAILVYIII